MRFNSVLSHKVSLLVALLLSTVRLPTYDSATRSRLFPSTLKEFFTTTQHRRVTPG
jgi:hypothetical protein